MSLTREQILDTKPPPPERVPWVGDGFVYVAAMGSKARDSYEKACMLAVTDEDPFGHVDNARATLLARCLVDEQGQRLFADDDVDALGEVWGQPMVNAFEVAKRLNNLSDEDMEELAKNCAGAPSDFSGTT